VVFWQNGDMDEVRGGPWGGIYRNCIANWPRPQFLYVHCPFLTLLKLVLKDEFIHYSQPCIQSISNGVVFALHAHTTIGRAPTDYLFKKEK